MQCERLPEHYRHPWHPGYPGATHLIRDDPSLPAQAMVADMTFGADLSPLWSVYLARLKCCSGQISPRLKQPRSAGLETNLTGRVYLYTYKEPIWPQSHFVGVNFLQRFVQTIEEKSLDIQVPQKRQHAHLFPEEFTYQYEMLAFAERASNRSHFLQQNILSIL